MKKFFALTLIAIAVNAYAACEEKYPFGKPKVAGNYTELCRKGYAVIHDNDRKIPFMTFEYLTPETIGRGQSERTSFKVDKDLPPQHRSSPKDYEKTGWIYDRGHLANAQNAGDDEAMADTMLMSNIVPQIYTFNRGSWKTLETRIAKDVRRGRSLYVITGAVPQSREMIGKGVAVPTHLFKVVIDKQRGDAVAYLMPNETNNKSYKDFKMSVGDLTKVIGVDLLPKSSGSENLIFLNARGNTLN